MATIKVHRKSLLNEILLNLCENFCDSGYYDSENKKAYAKTDSEVAADSLDETLLNLGYIKLEDDSWDANIKCHYLREDKVDKDGCWKAVFKEL